MDDSERKFSQCVYYLFVGILYFVIKQKGAQSFSGMFAAPTPSDEMKISSIFYTVRNFISVTFQYSLTRFEGVTFLAFGNGAPDVFSAIAAIGSAKSGDAGLAIGALFGKIGSE